MWSLFSPVLVYINTCAWQFLFKSYMLFGNFLFSFSSSFIISTGVYIAYLILFCECVLFHCVYQTNLPTPNRKTFQKWSVLHICVCGLLTVLLWGRFSEGEFLSKQNVQFCQIAFKKICAKVYPIKKIGVPNESIVLSLSGNFLYVIRNIIQLFLK